MRLFVAIHFSEEVKDALIKAIRDMKSQTVSGNFTRPENLHLTLTFIGDSEDVAAIKKVIDNLNAKAFKMAVDGSGHFGNLYWVGVEDNPELKSLADDLRIALRNCGFDIEDKPFKPHITLARQVEASEPLSINIQRKTMTVSRISLMKSERINGKLTYTEVYGRPLK